MKIAVTGGNGSIGQRVVLCSLKAGHNVVSIDLQPEAILADGAPDNSAIAYYQVDLTDPQRTLEVLRECDAVIHLAGIRRPGDYLFEAHNTNVVLSWNVLRSSAELGIKRVAVASSVNVISLVFSDNPRLHYLPLDEEHPCEPDEPYGVSKVSMELQADAIVRRYPSMRIASLRPHWSIPNKEFAFKSSLETDIGRWKKDLWGWVQEDSCAEAFLLAVTKDAEWSGHERFFIVAPSLRVEDSACALWEEHWSNVPLKGGMKSADLTSFFDCRKAEKLLGWSHKEP